MAQRMLSFIHSRAPRAIGVSDKAIDEHRELIHDLYITRNYTRDQVIAHLKTNLNFNLSPDQFSRAIRRWGFRKQFHSGKSTQPPPDETAGSCATANTPSNDLSCTTDGEHPATAPDPCPLPCTPAKQSKRRIDLDDIPNIDGDCDITMSSPTREKSIEPIQLYSSTEDNLLSAEYLACCHHYTRAFHYYYDILMSFEGTHSYRERRARILDMAGVASTRRTCELVRRMIENELEMSDDPLANEGHSRGLLKQSDMCRMQSFLFHRHLAQIYAYQNDGASMRKHLDKAGNFTKTFDTDGAESIDLWTLLFLVQDKTNTGIPGDILGSLQWDLESYGLNLTNCLQYCWRKLNPAKSMDEARRGYYTDQRVKTEPTEMSDLAVQLSSGYLWKRSSILFTFLWKEIQLTSGTLPWMSGHPTISPAHILLIVSRIIVKRSCLISKLNDDLPIQEKHKLNIHPANLQLYCDSLLGQFHDNLFAPNETKREFATQFVEHHEWFSQLDVKSALASQSQSYPIEVLSHVMVTNIDGFTVEQLSKMMENWTPTSRTLIKGERVIPTVSELSRLLGEHKEQRVLPNRRPADSYIQDRQFPPPSYSSGKPLHLTFVSSHDIYLDALKANPTMTRSLASRSSCSSQRSYSSSLQRFKAAALSRQQQPRLTMALSEDSDVLMGEGFLENLQEDECLDLENRIHD
ncbi:hypothetical protein DER45DRAFT_622032 [Fusarium avenaceum]|nr:hypothetical protein DER45DRAFT_622032 [Fusarium avenaceum]